MAHVSHVAQLYGDSYQLTSTLPQCDAVSPILQLVQVFQVDLTLFKIPSVNNEIQFHQFHDLYESYDLKRPLPHGSTGQ